MIVVSYYGSRGNRAKWIGAGALIIAVAQLLVSTPNFAFNGKKPQFNLAEIESRLRPDERLLGPDATIRDYFNYALLKDRIPPSMRNQVLRKLDLENSIEFDVPIKNESPVNSDYVIHNESSYGLDEPLISEMFIRMDSVLRGNENDRPLIEVMRKFVENRIKIDNSQNDTMNSDLETLRKSAVAHFSFCNTMVNDMRTALKVRAS